MSTGRRPSPLSQLLHDRGVRLAAGLAIVVAIPVAVLFYFQLRSLNDLETTSAVVLRQLSTDTADNVTKAIEEALKRPHIGVLLRIPAARFDPLDLAAIDPVFEEGFQESPFIDEFYVWSLAAPPEQAGKWLVYDRESVRAPEGDMAARFREDPETRDRLLAKFQEMSSLRRAIVAFADEIHGRKHYIHAQLRWSSAARDRLTSLMAFAVDAEQLRTQYFPRLVSERLASLQQPRGFAALNVSLVDDAGGIVIAPPPGGGEPVIDERTFPLVFFDAELLEFAAPYEEHREIWRLRTSYGATIREVVSASTRPQIAMMMMLAAILGVGVLLVSGAAAREVRLAELKSNFVASVSHDLKTPLALIQLFAETLELGRVKSVGRAQEYYGIINGEAKKLTRLIENILDFSRMEAGLRPYKMAPADIGEIVQRVHGMMNHQFAQGQFEVTTRVGEELPAVLADEDAVERAVENLLANAMKYSGEARTIDVDVRTEHGHVVVDVRDHGIGIARREQRRIFRKFYRVGRDLGGGPQGTGLGLAIVDHTMRGHGGYVRVDSEPGHGSTFSLHFPVPAYPLTDGAFDEAHSGDRGRAADAARPA